MVEEVLSALFDQSLSALFDPRKRVYWGYLISGCVIALLWLMLVRRRSFAGALRTFFSPESWLSRSASSDYTLMLINSAVMKLIAPRLLTQIGVSVALFSVLHDWFGGRPLIGEAMPSWLVAVVFTLTLFVLDDFSKYVVHRMLHRLPVLWAFHKVHHSATSLNPFTVYRTHPVEGVVFILRAAVVHGSCIAVFVFFLGDKVSLTTVLGASVFSFAFNALGANLRHSHVDLGFWKPLERLFISPAQHQIHHSTSDVHLDKNFGVALALWDLMFKTHCYSTPGADLEYGVRGESSVRIHSLGALYVKPFRDAVNACYPQGKAVTSGSATVPGN